VDPDACILCGACVEECPFSLLEMTTPDSIPTPRDIEWRSAQERCVSCGHCATVCPTDALTVHPPPRSTIPGIPLPTVVPHRQGPEDCPLVRAELRVSPTQVDQQLMARRSHRAYEKTRVPREKLEQIIRIAAYAPTPHNSQSARWLVISDGAKIRRIGQAVIDFMKDSAGGPGEGSGSSWDYRGTDSDIIVDLWEKGEDSIFRGAPHLVIVYGPGFLRSMRVPQTQFVINLTFLELAACARGLATVWDGYVMAALELWPPVAAAIGLPKGQEVYAAMSVGYPKNTYRRIPVRNGPEISWE
jgi:nitroreductase/NAD-dependent dihydropyrimidine dehydrogenase PreA subunit